MRLPVLATYLKAIKRLPNPPKSFMPNLVFTLIRTERRHANQAVFKCPSFMNRFEIYNYLASIYDIHAVDVTTINYPTRWKWDLNRMVKQPIPAFKKAFVTLPYDWEYPPTVNTAQLNEETLERCRLPRFYTPKRTSKKARKFDGKFSGPEQPLFPEQPPLEQYK
jgi:hypothetical protein